MLWFTALLMLLSRSLTYCSKLQATVPSTFWKLFGSLFLTTDNPFSPFPQNWTSTKWEFPGTIQELQIIGVTQKALCLVFCCCCFFLFVYLLHLSNQWMFFKKSVHVFWSRSLSTHVCPKESKIKSQHSYKYHSLHPQHKYTHGQI